VLAYDRNRALVELALLLLGRRRIRFAVGLRVQQAGLEE
jgi:hypothetical protein